MTESCKISAVTIALRAITNNEQLTRKLVSLREDVLNYSLHEDYLRQVPYEGEGLVGEAIHESSLKAESADMKFKAILFGGFLAQTKQGDEALDILSKEIAKTGGTAAEGLSLMKQISEMSLEGLEDVAKHMAGGDIVKAQQIVDNIRSKVGQYVGTSFSVVNSGTKVKVESIVESLQKKITDAEKVIDGAKKTLGGKTYGDVDKDLNRIKNATKDNRNYWNTKKGKEELSELGSKYGVKATKANIEKRLIDISEAKKTLSEKQDEMKILKEEYKNALNDDIKLIEDGQNPFNFIGADNEWKFTKTFNGDVSDRAKQYGQYALARALLTDGKGLPQEVYDVLLSTLKAANGGGLENLGTDLNEEWILDESRTLDELLSRAYLNTQQLVSDGELRTLYRQRLLSLASDGELSLKDITYIESLLDTMRFAGEGAGFSNVLKYNTLKELSKELGIKTNLSARGLWRAITNLFADDKFSKMVYDDVIKLSDGTEITNRQLLELTVAMVGDINLEGLILQNSWTDRTIIDIAGKFIVGDSVAGKKLIKELVEAVKATPTADDTRGVILNAITGKNIPEGTPIGFFDFRKGLHAADDVKERAKFRDRLAEGNKIEIPSSGIKDLTTQNSKTLLKRLEGFKGGIILVNDAGWRMSDVLVDAIDTFNKTIAKDASEKIQVAFPKGGLMGKLSSSGLQLFFSSSYSTAFENFLRKISMRTLGTVPADSRFGTDMVTRLLGGDIEAVAQYNKLLEEDAKKYFAAVLGVNAYDDRLPSMIEEATGMSFKNYDSIVDKRDFWRKVDERFTLTAKVLGKYDQEVTTAYDVIKSVNNMNVSEIATDLSDKFGFEISESQLLDGKKLREDVKQAYINYLLSGSSIELLENKGRLLAVINGGMGDAITVSQFKSMIQTGDFSSYKEIFFNNMDMSDEELASYVKTINDMIFEGLCGQVANNLVGMGYSLPLVNIRQMVYSYITDTLDANNGFMRAFLYKNGLDETMSTVNGIVGQAMPVELTFKYDDAIKKTIPTAEPGTTPGYIKRIVEVKNDFLQDTYSSLISMAAISDGVVLEAGGHERRILEDILTKYYDSFSEATKKGKKLSFKEAQRLKLQAGYALDMYEQDFLLPKYRQFMTPSERAELFGLKYSLGITTEAGGLKEIEKYNNMIMKKYDTAMDGILYTADIYRSGLRHTNKSISDEVRERERELIERGATLKVMGGQVVVVDIRDELLKQLRNLPENVLGLERLQMLGRTGVEAMSNSEVYFLLQLVQLAKNADNKLNLITQTIYRLNPRLANIDFFNYFKVENGLPKALSRNLLMQTEFLAKFSNTESYDRVVKRSIFERIKSAFGEYGRLVIEDGGKLLEGYEALVKIVDDAVDGNVKELGNTISGKDLKQFKNEAKYIYDQSFKPYVDLVDVPDSVKKSINEVISIQQKGIMDAITLLGDNSGLVDIMDDILIQGDDGAVRTFREVMDGKNDSISKMIFGTDNDIIAAADEAGGTLVDESRKANKKKKTIKENENIMKEIQSNYDSALRSILNEGEMVSQSERELMRSTWANVRTLANQYTGTKIFSDTDNALSGISEEIMRGFKSDVMGFAGTIFKGGESWFTPWKLGENIQKGILDRWGLVKNRYLELYRMPLEQFSGFSPKNYVDSLAYNLARYFKEIESRCGSLDGIRGAATNSEVNMAFAHLGEVIKNVSSIEGLYALMSGVEGNEILKFFKFAKSGDAAYIKQLSTGGIGRQVIYGYRNYVDKSDIILDMDWFNETFATNFSRGEYERVIQALAGFRIIGNWSKPFMDFFNFVNASNFVFRALISWPGQFLTIHPQNIGYFLRQKGREQSMGIEDLGKIDKVRTTAGGGILVGAFNEINWSEISQNLSNKLKRMFSSVAPDDANIQSGYNRFGVPDVEGLMSQQKFYTSDDISSMYAKIDRYGANERTRGTWVRSADAYKDNANNLVDGLWARNFKNIAFVRALQSNSYMRFATAEQFANFLASDAPALMKQKALTAINAASGANFKNILGLGFSGLDRAVGGSGTITGAGVQNVFIGMMQMFNFRGAWGRNIFKSTGDFVTTALRMARKGLSKEGKDAIAIYIAKHPEFTNFVTNLFYDLKHSWMLVRYQDNGDWPVDSDMNFIDFIQYAFETLQFSSQRWQGIQSFGTSRILADSIESAIQSNNDPDIYKDTLGVGALINGFSKNLGRNWKVPKLIAGTLAMTSSKNMEAGWEYLSNEFWKLSFGTLRYLMNEDETSYGYNTEMIKGRPGAIPFVITGEVNEEGDKAFSYDMANSETIENLRSRRMAIKDGDKDAERIYRRNAIDSFVNASQMLGTIKTSLRGLVPHMGENRKKLASDLHIYNMTSPFDLDEVGKNIQRTEAGKEMMLHGKYRPTETADIEILIKQVLGQANYRPGNNGFNKSMFNFDESGHMKNLEESADSDIMMELLLSNIKYLRDDNFNYVLDEKGNRIVNYDWEVHMKDLQSMAHDTSYMTNLNYNFINNRVEENNDDPNYQLYKELIGEGMAARYANKAKEQFIKDYNDARGLKGTNKLNKDKLDANKPLLYSFYDELKLSKLYLSGEQVDFISGIMFLSRPATEIANVKMVERQLTEMGDDETIKKLFTFDKNGNVNFSTKYKEYLLEQGRMSEMLNKGDTEGFIAETASITRMFKKDDPYGIMTTSLISSRINRIYRERGLTPEQKSKAICKLMEDNHEFIQTHIPEFIDSLGDMAKDYIDEMNKFLYNDSLIADELLSESEASGSGSGRGAALRASNLAKDLLGKVGKSSGDGGDGIGRKNYDYKFIPVKLDGAKLIRALGGKGYSPITGGSAFQGFKPGLDLSLSKDINRKVKNTKTQTIANKKQLSNIETKTEKALEAES